MTNKQETLKAFIKQHIELPLQRSQQWVDDRVLTIGGSEMSTISGDNPYGTLKELVMKKAGLLAFNGNVNTYWGTVLEDHAVTLISDKLECKVYDNVGSLPGIVAGQKYSPDGLAYVPSMDKIVLFEIKCAIRRIADGKVPAMYKPQVFTGLDTIPIADQGIFVDAMFRRCSRADMVATPVYDGVLHNYKPIYTPKSYHLMCVYRIVETGGEVVTDATGETGETGGEVKQGNIVDLGACPVQELEHILRDVCDGKLHKFFPRYVTNAMDVDGMYEECDLFCSEKKVECIGILPLKLFGMHMINVNRNDWKLHLKRRKIECGRSYTETYAGRIADTIANIKKVIETSEQQRYSELTKLYPPSPKAQCLLTTDEMDDIANSLCA